MGPRTGSDLRGTRQLGLAAGPVGSCDPRPCSQGELAAAPRYMAMMREGDTSFVDFISTPASTVGADEAFFRPHPPGINLQDKVVRARQSPMTRSMVSNSNAILYNEYTNY